MSKPLSPPLSSLINVSDTAGLASAPRRRLLAAGAGLAAATLLPAPAIAQSLVKLSFQLSWIRSAQYAGYLSALENGFYREVGLEPEFVSGGPQVDAVANVAAGRSQLGDRPSSALAVGRDKGIKLRVIGTVFQKSPFSIMSLESKPIKTVKELAGKTMAISVSSAPLVRLVLKDAGVDPDTVNIIPAGADPGALATGQVDAYTGYLTNQGVMLMTRGVKLHNINLSDIGLPNAAGTLYGLDDYLVKNRATVVKFLRASVKGWRWALDNPEKATAIMLKIGAPGLDERAVLTEIRSSREYIYAGLGTKQGLLALDLDYFGKELELLRRAELVKTPFTVNDWLDPSYIGEALKAQ